MFRLLPIGARLCVCALLALSRTSCPVAQATHLLDESSTQVTEWVEKAQGLTESLASIWWAKLGWWEGDVFCLGAWSNLRSLCIGALLLAALAVICLVVMYSRSPLFTLSPTGITIRGQEEIPWEKIDLARTHLKTKIHQTDNQIIQYPCVVLFVEKEHHGVSYQELVELDLWGWKGDGEQACALVKFLRTYPDHSPAQRQSGLEAFSQGKLPNKEPEDEELDFYDGDYYVHNSFFMGWLITLAASCLSAAYMAYKVCLTDYECVLKFGEEGVYFCQEDALRPYDELICQARIIDLDPYRRESTLFNYQHSIEIKEKSTKKRLQFIQLARLSYRLQGWDTEHLEVLMRVALRRPKLRRYCQGLDINPGDPELPKEEKAFKRWLKGKYRSRAKLLHPDRHAKASKACQEEYQELFKVLNTAKEDLGDRGKFYFLALLSIGGRKWQATP